VKCIFTCLSIY